MKEILFLLGSVTLGEFSSMWQVSLKEFGLNELPIYVIPGYSYLQVQDDVQSQRGWPVQVLRGLVRVGGAGQEPPQRPLHPDDAGRRPDHVPQIGPGVGPALLPPHPHLSRPGRCRHPGWHFSTIFDTYTVLMYLSLRQFIGILSIVGNFWSSFGAFLI